MGTSVVGSVEMAVEFSDLKKFGAAALDIRLLGRLAACREGAPLQFPASRKVRALFAYLALAPNAVTRTHLCELLWDVPNDPRGELRWCLSKLRSIVDTPERQRVMTDGDTVWLDLSDCAVDAAIVAHAVQSDLAILLVALFTGDFLEDVEIDRNPGFYNWLTAQRRRFRACHTAILERLVGDASGDEAFGYLDRWIELAPFDQRVHELVLKELARRDRFKEGEEHLAATVRLFESEGLDHTRMQALWRAVRVQTEALPSESQVLPVLAAAPDTAALHETPITAATRRASIAVMPFIDRSEGAAVRGGSAGALAYDVITRLAKLRALFVIAQGTVFALHERGIGAEQAGRMLNVDYVVSGSLSRSGDRIMVAVELAETRTARIVWAEVFNRKLDDAFAVLDEIGNRIVASIASEIETIERNRAILRPPNSLDAWEAHHRGLWHMYRFSRADNERAQHFFKRALQLDPTFARAYAGLSFTHFQNAFQGWSKRGPEIDRAYEAAGQALMADDRDPAAHWAMGRAQWLRGNSDQSVAELAQSVDLSPNFALAHYNLAFVHSTNGDPGAAIPSSDYSRDLSPFDPMLFGMLGARAMALVRLERFDEAAEWAIKAAARPNAFAHIHAIAAYSLALAGRVEAGRAHMAVIHKELPRYAVKDFVTAMQFDPSGAAFYRDAAKRLGGK
jgi:DNA-binding SARP family transcriptional activator/TolB-like protein/Flp pilus assembly protein TadD